MSSLRQYDPDNPFACEPVDRFDSFFGIRASTDIPPYFYIQGDFWILTGDQPEDKIYISACGLYSAQGVQAIKDGKWKLIEA